MNVSVGEKKQHRTYKQRDQFGAEVLYFSDCVLNDREPEPSGQEGLADIRIIRAIEESARTGKAVMVERTTKRRHPSRRQEITRTAVKEPPLVNAESAAAD